ncbi:hypothetical protein [Planktothricoides sp. SR001]|uniref:hypothetical protein n=1 Tax=Planktothricoides sp. SR001 TaxID=1705388 RepID=UPI0012E24AEA|nr:hypothetical protein [Planktothricoides sp. SR001]
MPPTNNFYRNPVSSLPKSNNPKTQPQKPGFFRQPLPPTNNFYRNPVSSLPKSTPQKPGFCCKYQSYLFLAKKKPGFLRLLAGVEKPGFCCGYQGYLFLANKKPGFLRLLAGVEKPGFFRQTLPPTNKCHRNPVSFLPKSKRQKPARIK